VAKGTEDMVLFIAFLMKYKEVRNRKKKKKKKRGFYNDFLKSKNLTKTFNINASRKRIGLSSMVGSQRYHQKPCSKNC
jgi:hypothetical protein